LIKLEKQCTELHKNLFIFYIFQPKIVRKNPKSTILKPARTFELVGPKTQKDSFLIGIVNLPRLQKDIYCVISDPKFVLLHLFRFQFFTVKQQMLRN